MKKISCVLLAFLAASALCLSGCATGVQIDSSTSSEALSDSAVGEDSSAASPDSAAADAVDLSAYPSDINEWTTQNFNDYFTAAGVYTNADWVYVQDHATYYAGTPIDEACGYMDEEGMVNITVFLFDPNLAESGVQECIDHTKSDKEIALDEVTFAVDHMVGNVVFWYSQTLDEEVYNAMDAAYNNLIAGLGVTPEY